MYNPSARKPCFGSFFEVHITRKTKRGLPAFRCPAEGSDRPIAKPFGRREQERAARRMEITA